MPDGVRRLRAPSGAGSYTYLVKPSAGTIEIVSNGSFNGITRRVDVTAKTASGQQVFIDAAVKTQNGIIMDSNSEIHSGTATGGDMLLASNSHQCGLASVGVGHHLTTSGNAGYFQNVDCTTLLNNSSVAQQDITLPPVNQGDAAVNNDNARITAGVSGTGSPADLLSGKTSDVTWSASTRQLTIDHNSSLTLTGHVYSFCTLTLNSNSALYIAAGQTVNIYFDSPEACNLPLDNPAQPANGTTQMKLSSNTRITSSTGAPATVAIYFVGSQSRLTNLLMSSNTQVAGSCVQNFIIYAPLTHIEMNSNTQYCGALAGQSLHMDSNAEVFTDSLSQGFILPGTAPHYIVSRFLDCSAVERLAAQRRVLRGAGMETRRAIATETDGFTLPELLIGTVIGLIVIGAAVTAMTVRRQQPASPQLASRQRPAGAHHHGADHARAAPGVQRADAPRHPSSRS